MNDKCAAFRQLHESCFVLPNPWDRGSARFLAAAGYAALATTSAGLAFSLGRPDTPAALDRNTVLANIRDIVEATDLPVNADFQSGYGRSADEVRNSVSLCVQTGVAGLSIEDATGEDTAPLFDLTSAVERVRAARAAIDDSGRNVVLTARAECFLVGHPTPMPESLPRLVAYAEAGADCLYAPGLRTDEEVSQVVRAVAPLPVNVLAADPERMTLRHLTDLGVRRISVGSALARVAWRSFMQAARSIQQSGSFETLAQAEPFASFDALFSDNQRR